MDQMMKATGPKEFEAHPKGAAYGYFLLWLILFNVMIFAGFGLYLEGFLDKVLEGDRSRISLLIMAIFAATSVYVGWHIYKASAFLLQAQRIRTQIEREDQGEGSALSGSSLVDEFYAEMRSSLQGPVGSAIDTPQLILEIYADKLRASQEMSNFVIDVLIRLGLIGTIIGFIMMLQSFVTGPSPTAENIQALLITMSSGMGTALYTTFAGLVASTLLGLQTQFLARNVEDLLAMFIRIMDETKPHFMKQSS